MDIEIAAFYCVCDELLKSLNHQDQFQCRMSAAEVMAAALTAAAMRKAAIFSTNIEIFPV